MARAGSPSEACINNPGASAPITQNKRENKLKTEFKKSLIGHNVEHHDRNHIFTWVEPDHDGYPTKMCAMHSKAAVKDYIMVLKDESMDEYENHDWAAWKLLSELNLKDDYTLLRTTLNPSDYAFWGGWIYLLMRKVVSS